MKCATGRFMARKGAIDCEDCGARQYQPGTGKTACLTCNYECAAGRYHKGCGLSHAGQCVGCDAGRFKAQEGTHGCTPCDEGHYMPSKGATQCQSCTANNPHGSTPSYQDEFGATTCKRCDLTCPAGEQHTACEGGYEGHCELCARGTFKAQDGKHACQSCAKGRYHFMEGATGCRNCPDGKFQSESGQTRCQRCDYTCKAGSAHSGCGADKAGSCKPCKAGTYKSGLSVSSPSFSQNAQ